MPDEPIRDAQGWWSREHILILALGMSTLIALFVCYLIVQPFIPAIAIAAAVAVATSGPHRWLLARVGSRTAAAAISVALVACLIVVPLSLLIAHVVRQIIEFRADGGIPDLRGLLPGPLARALDWAESHLDLRAQILRIGQALAGQAGNFLAGSVAALTQLVIMLFVLFFLYRDSDHALAAVRRLMPLSPDEADRMFSRIRDTILATVNGSLTVAFVQAVLAGAMYTALGVPASMIWAAATFLVALVPVFGTFMVWGPVAAYLLITGSWIKALILVGWGMLAVGTIDNILYPYLVGGRLRLHTLPTFFAIVGGIALFGPAGLILGPVALAVTMGLLDIWWWRTAGGKSAEQALENVP